MTIIVKPSLLWAAFLKFLYQWIDKRSKIPWIVRLFFRSAHFCPEMDGLLILTKKDGQYDCFCGWVERKWPYPNEVFIYQPGEEIPYEYHKAAIKSGADQWRLTRDHEWVRVTRNDDGSITVREDFSLAP